MIHVRALLLLIAAATLLPHGGALPGACGAECEIESSSNGYDPAVAIIASGSSVRWYSPDITHVTRDVTVGSSLPCFEVLHARRDTSLGVRFDATQAGLFATVGEETLRCTSATGHSAGGYALTYFCTIHPTMRGALVVTT